MEIQVVKDVLAKDKALAGRVRDFCGERGWLLINIISSPGSGKTALLEKLIPALTHTGVRAAVIEGDVSTSLDADRLQKTGAPVVLVNTDQYGGGCHLTSNTILAALEKLDGAPGANAAFDVVLIENIGNLICPAASDCGAALTIVLLSVTEGEDKPQKYPQAFHKADLVVISKNDLTQAVEADINTLLDNVKKMSVHAAVIQASAKKNEGIQEIAAWITGKVRAGSSRAPS